MRFNFARISRLFSASALFGLACVLCKPINAQTLQNPGRATSSSTQWRITQRGHNWTCCFNLRIPDRFESNGDSQEEDQKFALTRVCELSDENMTELAVFSPTEPYFAVIAADGTIHILDITGRHMRTLRFPAEQPTALAYSPDGSRLMVGTQSGEVLIWDLRADVKHILFQRPGIKIARVAWLANADRGVAAIALDYKQSQYKDTGFVFNLQTGKVVWHFRSYAFANLYHQALAIAPDDKMMAVLETPGQPRGATLLDLSHNKRITTLFHARYESGPLSVAFSPDNSTLAVGYAACNIILWNTQRQEMIHLLKAHDNWVVALAFSPDGTRLISGAGDSTARVWDVQTGLELGRIRFAGDSTYVGSVAFSPDGKLVLAVAENGQIIVAKAQMAHISR